jgi:hypothetical protein
MVSFCQFIACRFCRRCFNLTRMRMKIRKLMKIDRFPLSYICSGTPSSVQPGRVLHHCYIGRLDGKDLLVTAPIGSVLHSFGMPSPSTSGLETILMFLNPRSRRCCLMRLFVNFYLTFSWFSSFVFFYTVKRPWQIWLLLLFCPVPLLKN